MILATAEASGTGSGARPARDLGATGCEECEGGEIPNWPTRKLIYPLPDGFDHEDALAKGRFDYIVIVRIGTRYFLAHAIPRWQMRTVKDLPLEMIGAYITLGFLPPAQLACRLIEDHDLVLPSLDVLARCHRSIAVVFKRWSERVKRFEKLLNKLTTRS